MSSLHIDVKPDETYIPVHPVADPPRVSISLDALTMREVEDVAIGLIASFDHAEQAAIVQAIRNQFRMSPLSEQIAKEMRAIWRGNANRR